MKNVAKLLAKIFAASTALLLIGTCNASAISLQEGAEAVRGSNMPTDLLASFRNITDTVLIVVGAIAVFMMIIGGIRYILSGGDSKKVTDAKNTILYAVIGLVIIFFSYAIVHFVIKALPQTEDDQAEETSLVLTDSVDF